MDKVFDSYASLFKAHGHNLYMVGGTSRDYLLGLSYTDFDFVTDATPEQMKEFLPNASYAFARFGSISIRENGIEVDITTLRQEGEYNDKRHPSFIKFVDKLELDVVRRDFTINAIYIDSDYNIIDLVGGMGDLKAKTIRFIGDPDKRIGEDPLRILRAYRFSKKLGFEIEAKSLDALERNQGLIDNLNPEKVKMERAKENK